MAFATGLSGYFAGGLCGAVVPPGYAAFAWQVHAYMDVMCGRVIQASPPDQLGLKIIDALDPRDNRVPGDPFGNVPPRYNGAPSQQLWVIRQNPQTGERSLDLLQWGAHPILVPGQAQAAADQRQGGDGRSAAYVP